MNLEKETSRLYQCFIRMNRHHPPELLRWFVSDVLAGFGVTTGEMPPAHLQGWLFDQGAEYARIVHRLPFEDVLGSLYQQLASHGHRSHLAQFFTPAPIADLMAALASPEPIPMDEGAEPGRMLRMCEPACGSGALVLGFLRQLLERHGRAGPRRWSITAIDLDPLCAQICATQVLSNVFLGQYDLGELVVYAGNSLGPIQALRVVVHAGARDQRPDLVLPALHPSRVEALRQVQRAPAAAALAPLNEADEGEGGPKKLPPHARKVAGEQRREGAAQVDLFSD
jgi:hypothetical protein